MRVRSLRLDTSFNIILMEQDYADPVQVEPNPDASIDGNETANDANSSNSGEHSIDWSMRRTLIFQKRHCSIFCTDSFSLYGRRAC